MSKAPIFARITARACVALCLGAGFLAAGGAAGAQVLSIGPDGAVATYDGPAVVTSEGVRPLRPAPGGAARAPGGAVLDAITRSAARHDLDPRLLREVARQESGFRQDAVSRRGAVGVMQLMPATAQDLGIEPRDLAANVEGGAIYLKRLLVRYGGDVRQALAAYNAGPGATARYGGAPPFTETKAYVNSILSRWAADGPAGVGTGISR